MTAKERRTRLRRAGEPDDRDHRPAEQPLQLLAVLAARAPVAEHLPEHGDEPEGDERDRQDAVSGGRAGRRERALSVDPDVPGTHRGHVLPGVADKHDRADREVGPDHPAPAPRQTAVGEERDRQRQQDDQPDPARRQERSHARKRQVVPLAVVHDRVAPGVGREQEGERQPEQDPADRIARLPPRDDVADDPERHQRQPRDLAWLTMVSGTRRPSGARSRRRARARGDASRSRPARASGRRADSRSRRSRNLDREPFRERYGADG